MSANCENKNIKETLPSSNPVLRRTCNGVQKCEYNGEPCGTRCSQTKYKDDDNRCPLCEFLMVECICYADDHNGDDYYDDYPHERCDCGDCPDCGVQRPHMIERWGYKAAMVGSRI